MATRDKTPVRKARKIDQYVREAELVRTFRRSGQTVAGFAKLHGGSKSDFERLLARVRRRERENGWTIKVLRDERTRQRR